MCFRSIERSIYGVTIGSSWSYRAVSFSQTSVRRLSLTTVAHRTQHLTALAVWSVWTLSQTATGNALVFAEVTVRVRYFFVATFVLNLLCTGEILSHSCIVRSL